MHDPKNPSQKCITVVDTMHLFTCKCNDSIGSLEVSSMQYMHAVPLTTLSSSEDLAATAGPTGKKHYNLI